MYKIFTVAIYSPVKDETRLKEWILYYNKLGVDLFLINDDFSKISPKNYFKELNMNNYVIIKTDKPNWNYKTFQRNCKGSYTRTQIFTDHIIPLCKKYNIDYLMHFDSDEFLYLNKFKNIQEMLNYYQPFDELNINWLIFSDKCLKENKTDSLISSSNESGKYLNEYSKSITKVDSIVTGKNSHNCLIKQNSIIKSILNNIIPIRNLCVVHLPKMSFNDAPMFIAHYVFKDITNYVEKKLIIIDGVFTRIFEKYGWLYGDPNNEKIIEQKKNLVNYHKNNKNDLIDYIYALRIQDINTINNLEKKHKIFQENKYCYMSYYTAYGHNLKNNFPNGEKYYTNNNLLINYNSDVRKVLTMTLFWKYRYHRYMPRNQIFYI